MGCAVSHGEAARGFYDRVLGDEVVMLLPGGMRLDDRATIVEFMSGQPWHRYKLEDVRSFALTPDAGVVTYAQPCGPGDHGDRVGVDPGPVEPRPHGAGALEPDADDGRAGPVIERYGSAQPWPADRFG